MHKTIYIETDEEITSVIDRVKKEGSPDIFIVVPKNAMLVQGVINLKLLKKEAGKIKKNIVLVTNDKQAKKVIGRIGFETKEALAPEDETEEISQEEEFDDIEQASLESIDEIEEQEIKDSREIGSSSFFTEGEVDGFFDDSDNKEEEIINKKDDLDSPEKVIKRMDMIKNQEPVDLRIEEDEEPQSKDNRSIMRSVVRKNKVEKRKNKEVQEIFEEDIDFEGEAFQHEGGFSDEKAEEFFTQEGDGKNFSTKLFKKSKKEKKTYKSKKINYFFIFGMIIVFGIIGFGGWAYFNWPQMEVVVYPSAKDVSSTTEIEILANLAVSDIESGQLAGKMEEFEIKKTLEFDATGEKYSSDQGKAFGRVTIYNNYSSANQSLVATTRFLSEEGSLFRLVNSVTVPGMDGDNPGKIEVKVVADKPGSDFNIEPSVFTIEGFKSGPKYKKFEVKSDNKMTGGSDASGNNLVKYITEFDIENARLSTLEDINKSFNKEMEGLLSDSRGYVLDSAKKDVIENNSSYDAGDIADKFSYTIKQRVRLMTLAGDDLIMISKKSLNNELDSGYKLDENEITTEIIKDITDFEKNTMSLKVNVFGIAWPEINQEDFIEGIADQKEAELQSVLKNYQEIKKIDIKYRPGWMSGMSVSKDKINISEKRNLDDE